MKRSSKIILAICIILVVLLAAIYAPILTDTQPEMTPADAQKMLNNLADAFVRKNVADVLSFASPDAKVAGRKLESMRDLLHRFFAYAKHLEVQFRDVQY